MAGGHAYRDKVSMTDLDPQGLPWDAIKVPITFELRPYKT